MNIKLFLVALVLSCSVPAHARNAGKIDNSYAFPNPARERVNIRVLAEESIESEVTVHNLAGETKATMSLRDAGYKNGAWTSEAQLSTAGLPSGIYFYIIKTANGIGASSGKFAVLK